MLFVITFILLFDPTNGESLTELHKAMKEKHREIVEDVLAKIIKESVPYTTTAPQPALAEYETFHQSDKMKFIKPRNGKLIFKEFRRLSAAHAMNRIKGMMMDPL